MPEAFPVGIPAKFKAALKKNYIKNRPAIFLWGDSFFRNYRILWMLFLAVILKNIRKAADLILILTKHRPYLP
ncbi:hypothetical protein [uncultured Chryseobacterium sp.]|uniref:hypothetical protein n=1 Tax=uncultured Chryseobacterium sp. TaxID=259322 RepID=UPI0025CD58B9|nr:hypothetical protein [uncultured Chryseobacterium sp.]